MKNSILCENCNEPNPHYKLNCTNCNSYLRERVFNIDFWKIIWLQLESPTKAYKNIVYAEHKNLLYFLMLLLIIKLSLVSYTFNNYFEIEIFRLNPIFNLLLALVIVGVLIFYIFASTKILGAFKYLSEFKDNLAILVYSLLPFILSLLILPPLEYAILGKYFFNFETAPWEIKELPTYAFYFFEGLVFLYSIIQLYFGFKFQLKNSFLAIINSIKIAMIFLVYFIVILLIQ